MGISTRFKFEADSNMILLVSEGLTPEAFRYRSRTSACARYCPMPPEPAARLHEGLA